MSFTIEEKYCNWLKDFDNASKIVNDMLAKEYENKANPIRDLEELLKHKLDIKEKEGSIINKIEVILEEGNKKEKEEANRILKIAEEIRERDKNKIKELTDTLVKIGVFDDLMGCKDMIDINKVTNNLKDNKIENPHSPTGIFGMMELKRVVEAHKGTIKTDAKKFAEHLAKLEQLPAIKPTQLEEKESEE